jgi:hypothetical protein
MKLEIIVDSGDSPVLLTTNVKVLINGQEDKELTGIEFVADTRDYECGLILKYGEVNR